MLLSILHKLQRIKQSRLTTQQLRRLAQPLTELLILLAVLETEYGVYQIRKNLTHSTLGTRMSVDCAAARTILSRGRSGAAAPTSLSRLAQALLASDSDLPALFPFTSNVAPSSNHHSGVTRTTQPRQQFLVLRAPLTSPLSLRQGRGVACGRNFTVQLHGWIREQ
jgi:hypothetical protein